MTGGAQDRPTDRLPRVIPIFPLSGVLLLPRGNLPLHVFEPRYRAMTRDALAADRMIGMIQPTEPGASGPQPPIYPVGCAGRIGTCERTPDGRYRMTLTGVCRFAVVEELPLDAGGYRRVVADFDRYRADLAEAEGAGIDRERLLTALLGYFRRKGIEADWQVIHETPDERLVTALAMLCPFPPSEKQLLLEAADLAERTRVMITLLEMAVLDQSGGETPRH